MYPVMVHHVSLADCETSLDFVGWCLGGKDRGEIVVCGKCGVVCHIG